MKYKQAFIVIHGRAVESLETKMQNKRQLHVLNSLIVARTFLNNMFYSYGGLQIQKSFPSFQKKSRKHSGCILGRPCSACFIYLYLIWISLLFCTSSAEQVINKSTEWCLLLLLLLLSHTLSSLPRSSPVFWCSTPRALELRHDSKDGVVATDARPDLLVVLLGVADLVELRLEEHTDNNTVEMSLFVGLCFDFQNYLLLLLG